MYRLSLLLLMEEILQHLGCRKPCLNNEINCLSTGAGYLPSTVWSQLNLLNVQKSSSIPQFVSCAACRVESIRFVNQKLAWSRPMLMKLNYLPIYGVQWCATMETTKNAMKGTQRWLPSLLPLWVGTLDIQKALQTFLGILPSIPASKLWWHSTMSIWFMPNLALQEKRQKNNIKPIIYICVYRKLPTEPWNISLETSRYKYEKQILHRQVVWGSGVCSRGLLEFP